MKNLLKKILFGFLMILIGLIIINFILVYSIHRKVSRADFHSYEECQQKCIELGYKYGECEWPTQLHRLEYTDTKNLGSCLVVEESYFFLNYAKSMHCGNEGQCDCFCWNNDSYDL